MLGVLGEAALRTLLLATAVGCGLRLLRIRQSQMLLVAWTVVLGTSLSMPMLARFAPLSVPVIPVFPTMLVNETGDTLASTAMQMLANEGPLDEQPQRSLCWLFEAGYVVVAAAIASRVILGVILSFRLLAKSVPVHGEWTSGMDVRISCRVATPVTVARTVLLPLDAESWLAETRRAVLAHERAHVLRWDYAMLVLAQLNIALFWFSPLSWWLHRQLVVLAELASDDQVIAATGDGVGYAEILLEMGRRSGPLLRGVAMARPATLQYRIERVLSEHVSRAAPSLVQRTILSTVAAGLAIIAATSRTIPSAMIDPSLPRALIVLAEPPQSALSVDHIPSPSERRTPKPSLPALTSIALQVIPEPVSAEPPTVTPDLPAVGDASLIGGREIAKRVPASLPRRSTVQPARAARVHKTDAVQLGGNLVAADEFFSRLDGKLDVTGSVGTPKREMQRSPSPARVFEAETPAPRSGNEPSCTGVYLPKPGSPGLDGQVHLVQAHYFQAADGTPWLKLLFGSRTQTRVNGFTVERTSIRATVVAEASNDGRRISGSSHGVFGSIDYECLHPNARM